MPVPTVVASLVGCIVAFCAAFAPFAHAQKPAPAFDPGSRYICPNNQDSGLDCYLDAVTHLYTMCRHVKSIEIIEFGMEKAQEGVNGAKSEYCVDKQKINITRPYQAALREASGWREAVESLRTLQQRWLDAMVALRYDQGEAADSYQDRVTRIYDDLSYGIEAVRVGFTTAPDNAPAVKVPRAKSSDKSGGDKPKAKGKKN
jgi:hypothetical protein